MMPFAFRFTLLALSLAVLVPAAAAQQDVLAPASTQRVALTSTQAASLARLETRPTAARTSLVTLRTEALTAESVARFDLGREIITLPLATLTRRSAADASWEGRSADYRTTANLVLRPEGVTGSVRTPQVLYRLRPLGDGLHALIQVNEAAFPPDHDEEGALFVDDVNNRQTTPGSAPTDPRDQGGHEHSHGTHRHSHGAHEHSHGAHGHTHGHDAHGHDADSGDFAARLAGSDSLGVVIGYTPTARSQAGGTASIEALAQLAIDETNTAYAASGVVMRLKLVHLYETTDDNTTSFTTDLQQFTYTSAQNPAFAPYDEIQGLRATHGGDFAALLRGSGGSCGLGWVNASTDFAYTVTAWNCATGNYSFGHELGHNLGARHNTEDDDSLTPYAYGHGFLDTANGFRTIMGYNSGACPSGFCTRIQQFSSSTRTYNGNATGDENLRNVARLFDQRANVFANYEGSAVTSTLSLSTNAIDVVGLSTGQTTTADVDITNTGGGVLYYSAATRLDTSATGTATYRYTTSNDAGGPTASFTDISSTGTAITFANTNNCFNGPAGPDECFHTLALPFSFPYFGTNYGTVYVNVNGFLALNSDLSGSTGTVLPLPTYWGGLIAPFWGNQLAWTTVSSTIYYRDMGDGRFIVQWDDMYRYGYSSNELNTYQAILHADGTIEFQYESMQGFTNDFSGVTVGLESGDGLATVTLDYLEGFVEDNFAVEFTPASDWLSISGVGYGGVENGGTAGSLTVGLDATGLGTGTYTGAVTLTTTASDVFTTIPVTLSVLGTDYTFADGFGWRMLAAPAGGTTVADLADQNLVQGVPGFYPDAAANLYTGYDGTGFVEPASANEAITSGQGFLWYLYDNDFDPDTNDPNGSVSVALPMTISFSGTEPTSAVSVPQLHADGDGWNLLGNPFAGMLSVANIGSWSGTAGLQSTVGQMWQCVPDTSPTVECVGSYTTTTLAGNEIPVWQGVFYQATTAGTLEVPISARGTSQSRQQQPALLAFHLDVTDAATGARRTDRAAVLVLDDDALPEQDALDAEKLSPLTYPYVALAFEGTSEDGPVLLAQDARPLTATEAFSIPLVLETAGLAGTATLTWPQQTLPDGWRVQLTDRVTGTTVDLAEADVYTFEVAGAARTSSQAISALSRMAEAGVSLRASDTPRFDLHVLPPTATAADPEEAPRELALAPPYPNPTTGALSLTYSLPSATSVRLAVYDLLGRTVAVLADGEQAAGTWQTTWDASTAAAGVYVVRFEAAGQVQTQKVTVTTR